VARVCRTGRVPGDGQRTTPCRAPRRLAAVAQRDSRGHGGVASMAPAPRPAPVRLAPLEPGPHAPARHTVGQAPGQPARLPVAPGVPLLPQRPQACCGPLATAQPALLRCPGVVSHVVGGVTGRHATSLTSGAVRSSPPATICYTFTGGVLGWDEGDRWDPWLQGVRQVHPRRQVEDILTEATTCPTAAEVLVS